MKYLRIFIIAIILSTVGAFIWISAGSDPQELLLESLSLSEQKLLQIVLLLSIFILLSTLTGLPILYINLALGYIMGFAPAMLVSWGVNIISVMATFFLVRFLFSDYFTEKYGKKKLIRRINRRIGKYGMWTVAFSRAIYIIPTGIINFSFPLSKISQRSYLFGTIIGLLPECLIGVLSGYLLREGLSLLTYTEEAPWKIIVAGIFILLTALAIILLRTRRIKAVPFKK